jgi:ferric-dicitrate binding protein FerR (iron transport regulator)
VRCARIERVRKPNWKSGALIDHAGKNSLEELFVRYWENDLSEADAAEFQQRLASDPAAQEEFQFFCLQAMVAAELPPATNPAETVEFTPRRQRLKETSSAFYWTRRRILRYIGGGAAAIAAAGYVGRQDWGVQDDSPTGVQLTAHKGEVTLRAPGGRILRLNGDIPPGSRLATIGPVSSAVLSCPDGTEVSFMGDSEVALVGGGTRLVLRQGAATAKVPFHGRVPKFTILQTAQASLARLSNVLLTLALTQRGTEVVVKNGVAAVDAPNGKSCGIVRAGELLTVRADGDCSKQAVLATPDDFSWNLKKPLPAGWTVGVREETTSGPVVVPEFWLDPYYQVEMCQIRSDAQWARGFFRLYPDSILRVRYWVERPGPSQLVIVVRTESHSEPTTGVLECNNAFTRAKPGEWQVLEVKASEMFDTVHAPKFEAPWVGFLVIFNTYRSDIGLKIASFEVVGPGERIGRA